MSAFTVHRGENLSDGLVSIISTSYTNATMHTGFDIYPFGLWRCPMVAQDVRSGGARVAQTLVGTTIAATEFLLFGDTSALETAIREFNKI
jgi:hypothetical protein